MVATGERAHVKKDIILYETQKNANKLIINGIKNTFDVVFQLDLTCM